MNTPTALLTDAEKTIWERFRNDKETFKQVTDSWTPEYTKLFCQFVQAAHDAGLDCWHINKKEGANIGFGRKDAKPSTAPAKVKLMDIDWNGKKIDVWNISDDPKLTKWKNGRNVPNEKLLKKLEDYFLNNKPYDLKDRWGKPLEKSPANWPDEITILEREHEHEQAINSIYYGPPGTGKTYKLSQLLKGYPDNTPASDADEQHKRYAFVTFHQSYGYEEFVEGLRPVINEDEAASGDVQYEIRAGVFKQLCARARKDPENRYAMVIDEINRGNISKIFGELITLIELDKREGAPNALSVTLPYSQESFSVPANVDIIGTMNTADRSLALLDTALRRRFEFEPMLPKPELLKNISIQKDGKTIEVQKLLEKMNERIELLYDRDHCIGHAYFFPLEKDNSLEKLGTIFQKQIIPLLEEYFFEDWEKIRLVLGDNQEGKAYKFITKKETNDKALTEILGSGHGLDAQSQPARYAINAEAFDKVESYLGIYQASKQAAEQNQAAASASSSNDE